MPVRSTTFASTRFTEYCGQWFHNHLKFLGHLAHDFRAVCLRSTHNSPVVLFEILLEYLLCAFHQCLLSMPWIGTPVPVPVAWHPLLRQLLPERDRIPRKRHICHGMGNWFAIFCTVIEQQIAPMLFQDREIPAANV